MTFTVNNLFVAQTGFGDFYMVLVQWKGALHCSRQHHHFMHSDVSPSSLS